MVIAARRAGKTFLPEETSVSLPARIRAARDVTTAMAALYLLLAVLVGFAHRPIDLAPASPATAQTILPDGSVAVLCHTDPSSHEPLHHAAAAVCDACLITAAPGLAAEPPAAIPPVFAVLLVGVRSSSAMPPRSTNPSVSARGPPPSMTSG